MEAASAATADALDMPMVKLAIFAATCTAQREGDLTRLSETQRNDQGVHVIEQQKMKKAEKGPVICYIPFYLLRLQAALDAEMKRHRQGNVVSLEKRWLINLNTGEPYNVPTLSRHFAIVREHAAKTMPEVAGIQFRDLRDTFITRACEAGCDPIGTMALSGHMPPVLPMTWRHMKPGMATRALQKLMAYEADLGVPAIMEKAG